MKTQFVISAIFILGLLVSPMMVNEATPLHEYLGQNHKGEKNLIDLRLLPIQVKNSIKNEQAFDELRILEVWEVITEDGITYYEIKFDHIGEQIIKKYNPKGREVYM